MKYGIREICDVVLKAIAKMTVGHKVFYKDEPVIYFDSLKTSTMEGAATTVYAQGGRGNSRLIAWEGERTVTFTMEDALISTVGLAILTGADVIDATADTPIRVHITETVEIPESGEITLKETPYQGKAGSDENYIYVMKLDNNGNVETEPYLYKVKSGNTIELKAEADGYKADENAPKAEDVVLVDYYTERNSGVQQIEITPDKFGGNFYLEASTLFRDTNGVDMPAEFIIPNCKVQSNFTFTMASSGDPSTFTFTMDAFPDYTRFNRTKKVLSAIQVIADNEGEDADIRTRTAANLEVEVTELHIGGDTSAPAGSTVQLKATFTPYDANPMVTWAVTEGKATVNSNGRVRIGTDATDTVKVTATIDNGKSATHTITIA